MIAKPTSQQCLDIVKICIAHVSDNCSHEKGLFRVAASMNEVRRLKSLLCEGRRRNVGDSDSHVVAGVLLSTLKDMEPPLLHEIRDELLEIDPSDDSEENINGTARCISLLPTQKIEVFRLLSAMVHHLASTPGNDSNCGQLITSLAPVIYQPIDTSYMSIRHVELLKHVRPVLQFIADHSAAVFRQVGPSRHKPLATGRPLGGPTAHLTRRQRSLSGGDDSDSDASSQRSAHSFGGRRVVATGAGIEREAIPPSLKNFSAALQLSLHTESAPSNMEIDVGTDELTALSSSAIHAPVPNYSSWEWRVLEALACSRMQTWLIRPSGSGWGAANDAGHKKEGPGPHDRASGTSSTPVVHLQSHFLGTRDGGTDDLHLCDDSDEDGEDAKESNGGRITGKKGDRSASSARAARSGRCDSRRRLITECKGLRHEIQQFEDQWYADHKRQPLPHERGQMQAAYSRYKDLKRMIRDQAAADIQRVVRGFMARVVVRTLLNGDRDSGGEAMELGCGGVSCQLRADQKRPSNGWLQSIAHEAAPPSEEHPMNPREGHAPPTQEADAFGEESSGAADMQHRYRECLEVKRTLKRNLKKFDDDFMARKGRAPRKADKEVMRPQYQKYHEIRAELDKLKVEIIRVLGHFPAELEDIVLGSGVGNRGLSTSAWPDSQENNMSSMSAESESEDATGVDMVGEARGLKMQSPLLQSRGSNSATIPSTAPSKGGLDSLVAEKKQLHSYLKAFEKEFNRVNGRHVMHPEDIKPVADEYQRYKELKKVLKDLRSTL